MCEHFCMRFDKPFYFSIVRCVYVCYSFVRNVPIYLTGGCLLRFYESTKFSDRSINPNVFQPDEIRLGSQGYAKRMNDELTWDSLNWRAGQLQSRKNSWPRFGRIGIEWANCIISFNHRRFIWLVGPIGRCAHASHKMHFSMFPNERSIITLMICFNWKYLNACV